MRVSTSQQFDSMVQDIQYVRQRQVEGWNKIATGKRLSQPAEAPGDAVQLMGVQQEMVQIQHYLNTITAVSTQLSREDILLTAYNGQLQSVRELILRANNPLPGNEGLKALAQELGQWRNSIIDLLNTQDADSNFLFSGFQSAVPPIKKVGNNYIFNEDNNQRQVTIAPGRHITVNDTAHQLCFAINDGQSSTFNLITSLGELSQQLLFPDDMLAEKLARHLIRVDLTLAQAGAVQTDLGSRMKVLENIQDNYKQANLYYAEQAGRLGDLDYGEALTRLNQERIAIEAASKGLSEISHLTLFNYL